MIKFTNSINWKWLFIEFAVFAAIVSLLFTFVPTSWHITTFFIVGYLSCIWDYKYTRIINKE